MKNKLIKSGWMLLALSAVIPSVVFANGMSVGHAWGKCRHEGEIFNRAAFFVLKSQDQLGLTKEQVQSIKDLKLQTSKDQIRQGAEIKVSELDIQSQLHADKVDLAAVQKLIDQKYELKKTNEKASVEAYVKLKSLLTEQQLEGLKNIKKEHMQVAAEKRGNHGSDSRRGGEDKVE